MQALILTVFGAGKQQRSVLLLIAAQGAVAVIG